MVRSFATVLLFAAPLTAAWVYALAGGVLGEATYALPLGLAAVALGAGLLLAAAAGRRWALLALLVFAAIFLNVAFRVRAIGEVGLDPQNGIKIATWLLFVGLAALHWRRLAPLLADPAIALFGVFAVVSLLSSAWSPVPAYTAACAIGLVAYLGFACLAAQESDGRTICLALIWSLAAYHVATWVAAAAIPDFAYIPPYGDKLAYRLQGISGHPNILAKQTAILLLLVIAARRCGYLGRRAGLGLCAFGFATLLATHSRTALVSLLLSWLVVELRSRRLLLAAAVAGLALLGLLVLVEATGTVFDFDALLGSVSRTGDAGEILTLTGRTELWEFAWQKIQQSPLVGYGFNAFEVTMSKEWFGAEDAGVGAHNSLIQVLFTVGLIGTAPVVAAFSVLIRRWFARPNPLRDLFVAYVLISGLTEVDITAMPTVLTFATFLTLAIDARERLAERAPSTSGHRAASTCCWAASATSRTRT